MRTGRDVTWLGLTPEPERELPVAVAALRRRAAPPPPAHERGGRATRRHARGNGRRSPAGGPAAAAAPRDAAEVQRHGAAELHQRDAAELQQRDAAEAKRRDAAEVQRRAAAEVQRRDAAEVQWIAAERRRVEALILHGTQRDWLRYLAEVTGLVTAAAERGAGDPADRETRAAALRAAETVLDHHRMLIGLPGPAYERVAVGRGELTRAITALREWPAGDRRPAA